MLTPKLGPGAITPGFDSALETPSPDPESRFAAAGRNKVCFTVGGHGPTPPGPGGALEVGNLNWAPVRVTVPTPGSRLLVGHWQSRRGRVGSSGRLPISPDPDSEPRPSSSELAPDSGRSLMGL